MPNRARPVGDEKHLRLGGKGASVALWSWNVDSDRLTMDDIGYDHWALPKGSGVTLEQLSANIHPAGRFWVGAASAQPGVSLRENYPRSTVYGA